MISLRRTGLFRAFSVLCTIALLALAGTARAQFTIDWYTIDGGGAMNLAGGTFTLSGTAGQPDAGLLGGGRIAGGFWGLIAPSPPVLTIVRTGPNVTVSWPSPSTGFVLQQTTSLTAPIWNNVAQIPSDNGTFKSVTMSIAAPPSARFFRLSNP
jgi:hypothetical protein